MEDTSENKWGGEPGRPVCVGLLAHVDAGKTTLAESILYLGGSIRKPGRVDHGDAFLDTHAMEKSRGITIFSKQAEVILGGRPVTLLDTPGHVDFSAEMERTLQVLDYAVLVINGADGVQGHTETLWKLLKRYEVPVFLFINKMDLTGCDREQLFSEISERLSERCLDFGKDLEDSEFLESLAMCDETSLEQYLEKGTLEREDMIGLIRNRKVFPCYFGSALKMQGVEELLSGIESYGVPPRYPEEFGARVFKISRDAQGARLTHMKITGGSLKVKGLVGEEKADQIRIYSGASFRMVQEAVAGSVCAVTGLEQTSSGLGIGISKDATVPLLEPVLSYRILLSEEVDVHQAFLKLKELEEEEPLLHMTWEEELNEIHAQIMGEVQTEILKGLIRERFRMDVEFGTGSIVYKETIRNQVEGVGHFEPLRHYAEVHLILEPGERGSGLQFGSICSEDLLERNWQRLILTHLAEKRHRGVLLGAELTDVKLTLAAGKAHVKHTEGGDFRQATYRAVRQGLMNAESVLLEPVYEYRLEVPVESVGRALSDLQRMHGSFSPPEQTGEKTVLTGTAPVATMRGYQSEVLSYTKGRGRLFCSLKGYEPCHNTEEVLSASRYDPEADVANPTGSVFCAHGAGFVVPWNEVPDYMHLDPVLKQKEGALGEETTGQNGVGAERSNSPNMPGGKGARAGGADRSATPGDFRSMEARDKELEEIFARTYGKQEDRRQSGFGGTVYKNRSAHMESASMGHRGQAGSPSGMDQRSRLESRRGAPEGKEYLLVDGYNIIFAWEELKDLAERNIGAARDRLMDVLSNYQGYKGCTVILVFDAYKVEGNLGEVFQYHNIHVVFTKEAETADQYIEKTVHEIGRKYRVTVATSDALEQVIILGQGAGRMSAQGLKKEIEAADIEIREICAERPRGSKNYLFDQLPEELADYMEEVRLGKQELGWGEGASQSGKEKEIDQSLGTRKETRKKPGAEKETGRKPGAGTGKENVQRPGAGKETARKPGPEKEARKKPGSNRTRGGQALPGGVHGTKDQL
ncbi:MAG: GTP-binding protein [Lachnospiraceae bacterium]|nr:GTP-binding protein [Lachnospiraceae bacterium]